MTRPRLTIFFVFCSISGIAYWVGYPRDLPTARQHQILQVTKTLETMLIPSGPPSNSLSTTPPHGSPVAGRVSSPYGMRFHPRYKRMRPHRGVDIAAREGSHVMATADGWVHRIDHHPDGYGIFIEIVHPATGYRTLYAHLSKVHVRTGQAVTRGQVIALTGVTGNALGPHLHYEVKTLGGKHIDPMSVRR